jgi:tyrosinase
MCFNLRPSSTPRTTTRARAFGAVASAAAENRYRVRRSIQELQDDYARGDKGPLETLMRAWKGIKELPPDAPRSFFALGGLHGEPFRGPGATDPAYWGGYCNHGNVLFPTWHRVYLIKLEEALQSIPGCANVMLPYWDEASDDSVETGIPWALTQKEFVLDGVTIQNPLVSFVLPASINDKVSGANPNYSKPAGYETVRYPLSGLVGTEADRAATNAHNAQFPSHQTNVQLLNQNITGWLNAHIVVDGKRIPTNVKSDYNQCLSAPNYTAFSNTTSAAQWNFEHGGMPVVSLESPHNSIHTAVGGYDMPGQRDASPIEGANGDMGENDTASMDPIFYFHHCFVDRLFWLWQQRRGFTDSLEIIDGYPGTNSSDAQGPTPGIMPGTNLTLESPLHPFMKKSGRKLRPYTSLDCINIEKQLGITYSRGSLEDYSAPRDVEPGLSTKVIRVFGISRAVMPGSFLISAFVITGGERYHVGTKSVLSRWNVHTCANCQKHLEVQVFFSLNRFTETSLENAEYEAEIRSRNRLLTKHVPQARSNPDRRTDNSSFKLEVW